MTTVPEGFAQPGNCHRIALAVNDVATAMEQWKTLFGAGVMCDSVFDEQDGSEMGIVWMGTVPFLALGSTDVDGVVGRWLAKNGPGVQSLAWEVPDMWSAQNYLQQLGIGITGVHVPGRHFFMHPRDTFGLMLELTDDRLPGDPRQGLTPIGGGDGLIDVHGVAHVSAVVPQLEPVAALFARVFGVSPRPVANDGPEAIADFDIGDLTLRVIAPYDDSSEWHEGVVNGRGRLHSVALEVDLVAASAALDGVVNTIGDAADGSLHLDHVNTSGIQFTLVQSSGAAGMRR